jgi:hypothetical protein
VPADILPTIESLDQLARLERNALFCLSKTIVSFRTNSSKLLLPLAAGVAVLSVVAATLFRCMPSFGIDGRRRAPSAMDKIVLTS